MPSVSKQSDSSGTSAQPSPGRILLPSGFALLLSSVAGMTDAVGFGQTGEFVSFMSGNTTRVGIAFSSADPARGSRLLIVLFLFVIGSALGSVVSKLSGRRRATGLLLYVALLLALAAGLPAFAALQDTLGFEHLPGFVAQRHTDITLPSLVLILFAMGALNAVVESIAGVGVGITYVTGALAKFGRGLGNWLMGDRKRDWLILLVPWLGLVIGALLGARLDHRFGRSALWLPAALCAGLSLTVLLAPPTWQTGKD